jgi:hypothetical protein
MPLSEMPPDPPLARECLSPGVALLSTDNLLAFHRETETVRA